MSIIKRQTPTGPKYVPAVYIGKNPDTGRCKLSILLSILLLNIMQNRANAAKIRTHEMCINKGKTSKMRTR